MRLPCGMPALWDACPVGCAVYYPIGVPSVADTFFASNLQVHSIIERQLKLNREKNLKKPWKSAAKIGSN
jgi:hypothetical protein